MLSGLNAQTSSMAYSSNEGNGYCHRSREHKTTFGKRTQQTTFAECVLSVGIPICPFRWLLFYYPLK